MEQMVFHIKDLMLTLENCRLLEVKDIISQLRWKVVALPSRSVCFLFVCLFDPKVVVLPSRGVCLIEIPITFRSPLTNCL